jgi:hypothetical protein
MRYLLFSVAAFALGMNPIASQADEVVPSTVRQAAQAYFASAKPYNGPDSDMCAAAVAVLLHDAAAGKAEPADGQLWTEQKRTGPNCTKPFVAAGISVFAEGSTVRSRRVSKLRQLPDGTFLVGVDAGCDHAGCLGGAVYLLTRQDGKWIVDREVMNWLQ